MQFNPEMRALTDKIHRQTILYIKLCTSRYILLILNLSFCMQALDRGDLYGKAQVEKPIFCS